MIVCAIDDLIFSVKISTAAKQLGVDIYFERIARQGAADGPREAAVARDLRLEQLAPRVRWTVIAAMKADPELERVMTLGYVSHVDSDAIARGAQAGIDQVLARSAFAERLGAILSSSVAAV